MKKIFHEQVLRRKILLNKRLKRKGDSKVRRRKHQGLAAISEIRVLVCPKALSLHNKYFRDKLIEFIRAIHGAIRRRKRIRLDFSALESMTPHASLLLWSELCRIKKKTLNSRLAAALPRDSKCNQVFSQVGLSKLLNCSEVEPRDEDVVHWRAVSGTDVDGKKYAEELMSPYLKVLPDEVNSPLWIGVQEAMTNVKHHAYYLSRGDHLSEHQTVQDENWWMFSQEREGYLTVLICDLGAGIPRTVPNSKKENLRAVIRWIKSRSRSDAEILSAVLKKTVTDDAPRSPEDNASRTLEPYRGKGFYNIVKTVRSVDGGRVEIFSNKAMWRSEKPGTHHRKDFKSSIRGTIISWQIPLGADKHA